MFPTLLDIYRSPRRADCEERAFVLTAVGVPSLVDFDGMQYVLRVDAADADVALAHLERYALESRPPPPAPPPPPLHPFAWVGSAFYALTLLFVGYAVAGGFWRLDAFDLGALDAARVQAGEWWRAWTALTLHVDSAHLAANLGAGAWFGYLAGRRLGNGVAWLLVVIGAGLANLLEALLGPASHRAVGASTAVFAMLGMLAANSWRERFSYPQRWALRWAPLVAGVILLGWLGTEGEQTDVVAHLAGFVTGAGIGVATAQPTVKRLLAHVRQWIAGLAAVAILAVAWICALTS